jgi:hypothetical protein
MRTHIKGLAIAGVVAATLITASPVFAGQAVTIRQANGSKACIMLEGVSSNASDWVAQILGAVMEQLGC